MIYRKLIVYKIAKDIAIDIYKITERMPVKERFGLISQMNRSAISVPSNIAEGSSRSSLKEQIRYIEIAYGSLMELSCQLEIALELDYIDKNQFDLIEEKIRDLTIRLSNFKKAKEK